MYVNLEKELRANHFTHRSAAAAIGMAEPTFRSKMSGGRFTVEQAFEIKNRLLPKYELEYLFFNEEEQEAIEEDYSNEDD